MKILSITNSPNYSLNGNSKPNYIKHSSAGDTFERITNFKGSIPKGIQDTAMQILKNPNKILSGAGFAAAFYAALEALANGKEIFGNDAAQAAAEKFVESESEQIQENIEQTDDNDVLPVVQEKPAELESEQIEEYVEIEKEPAVLEPAKESETSVKKSIELPRRHGGESSAEKALRGSVEKIDNVSEDAEQKLLEIWNHIMSKGGLKEGEFKALSFKDKEAKKAEFYKLAEDISKALDEASENPKLIEEAINKFHRQIFRPYYAKVPDLPGFNVVGKISPETLAKMDRKPFDRLKVGETAGKSEVTSNTTPRTNSKDSWTYVATGTLKDTFRLNLYYFWKDCKTRIGKNNPDEHIAWAKGYPIPSYVTKEYIINEIVKKSDYEHVSIANAGIIADAINNTPLLKNNFSIHAALRFIDRFVDFKSEEGINEQLANLTNKLVTAIEKDFKEGAVVAKYKDPNGYIATNITLNMKNADKEVQRMLGTSNILLSVGENKNTSNNNVKYGIIKTIISQGK